MVKMMAVFDEDPVYAEKLADYVNQREKLPFTAMAFSSLEKLEQYMKEHPVEILLVGEKAVQKAAELKAEQCDGFCVKESLRRQRRKGLRSINISPGIVLCGR